jgi:hypothetical protein
MGEGRDRQSRKQKPKQTNKQINRDGETPPSSSNSFFSLLGNVGAAGAAETNKYAPTILDALMSSIDDANEDIAMEAMNGLAKVRERRREGETRDRQR